MIDELKQAPEFDDASLTEEIMEAIADVNGGGKTEEEVPDEYYFTNPDPLRQSFAAALQAAAA